MSAIHEAHDDAIPLSLEEALLRAYDDLQRASRELAAAAEAQRRSLEDVFARQRNREEALRAEIARLEGLLAAEVDETQKLGREGDPLEEAEEAQDAQDAREAAYVEAADVESTVRVKREDPRLLAYPHAPFEEASEDPVFEMISL